MKKNIFKNSYGFKNLRHQGTITRVRRPKTLIKARHCEGEATEGSESPKQSARRPKLLNKAVIAALSRNPPNNVPKRQHSIVSIMIGYYMKALFLQRQSVMGLRLKAAMTAFIVI